MIITRDIHINAQNMLFNVNNIGKICDFLTKLQKRYFATLNWHNMAEMHLSEKPQLPRIK